MRREVHLKNVVRLHQALLGILVRENHRACGVHRGVVVGMVEMPVRIDQQLDRPVVDAVEYLF